MPRLGDAAFRAQRQAVEHAEAALRKLAAQAHGEVLTQLLTAWERRDPATMPAAQALGARVPPATRMHWIQSLGAASPTAVEALLRLEMAAEVPTPADQLDARRQLQLQLLTRRHEAPPVETWGQDVAKVLAGAFDAEAARRLQNVLKVLLRR
jgi:ATP-dependent RNA helicase SUPV3L1/SUV3